MQKPDEVRLKHMLDAAGQALVFARNHSRADLDTDVMLVFALVKAIEIVGEAASQVTQATRAINIKPFHSRKLSECGTVWCMPTSISTWISYGERCVKTCHR